MVFSVNPQNETGQRVIFMSRCRNLKKPFKKGSEQYFEKRTYAQSCAKFKKKK